MIMTNKEKDALTLYCSCGVADGVLLKAEKDPEESFGIECVINVYQNY